jgi:hypothetical protein
MAQIGERFTQSWTFLALPEYKASVFFNERAREMSVIFTRKKNKIRRSDNLSIQFVVTRQVIVSPKPKLLINQVQRQNCHITSRDPPGAGCSALDPSSPPPPAAASHHDL